MFTSLIMNTPLQLLQLWNPIAGFYDIATQNIYVCEWEPQFTYEHEKKGIKSGFTTNRRAKKNRTSI